MKYGTIRLILCFVLVVSCSDSNEYSTEISTSTSVTSTTTSTIPKDPLIVSSFEDLPDALVRIEVSSTQAELNDDLEIEIFEYEGTGSGFFISSDGYIVTNNHVISGAVTIEVFTQYRSQPYAAKIIGLSECDDLAILKIEIDETKYLIYEDSEPKLGQEILAAGFPLGDEEVTFLNGIVSKKQANGSTTWASIEYAFEHTAEILPGSSGGPIVNEEVKVIGIAYAGNEDRQEFGIPIVVVKNKIEQIINQNFQYSFKANVEQFYGGGLYVYSVDSDSPLRKVGINGGELITEIKGLSITDEDTLKIYCDSLFARNPNIGITFTGVSLNDLEEFEVEVSLDGTVTNVNNRTSLTTTSTTTTTTTTTTIPLVKKYEYTIPNLSTINIIKLPGEDYILRVSAYLEYDDLGLNEASGYYDAIHNLTDCEITIFTGQNLNQYVWNTKYRGNCVTTKAGSQVTIYRDIDLRDYPFNWNNVPNNQIAIQGFQLYPVKNIDYFDVHWLFAYGGECSERFPCERSVETAPNLPRRRFTSDAETYKWISSSKVGTNTQLDNFQYYSSAGYCDENINQNGINWWGIYSYTPCFKNR